VWIIVLASFANVYSDNDLTKLSRKSAIEELFAPDGEFTSQVNSRTHKSSDRMFSECRQSKRKKKDP